MLKIFTYLLIINLLSFFSYGIDKYKAIRRKNRISERTLFLWGFIGGGVGSFLGMFVFHHKTKKLYFYVSNFLFIIMWIYIIWEFFCR